jgi:hypothetical protein
MKTALLSLALLFVVGLGAASAQERVTEARLMGEWRMMIDVEDEIRKDAEEEGFLTKMFLNGISGMVQGILDNIEIQMTFKKDGVLELVAMYDGEVDDVETLAWRIDEKGHLYIDDFKNDRVSIENDGYWMWEKGRLISFEEDGTLNDNVWMEKN